MGWRVWRIRRGELASLVVDEVWTPERVKVARGDLLGEFVPYRLLLSAIAGILSLLLFPVFGSAFALPGGLAIFVFPLACAAGLLGSYVRRPGLKNTITELARRASGVPAVVPGGGTMGLYAFDTPELLHEEFLATPREYTSDGVHVRGTVYMWGETIEHERGIKAQYAYPRLLEAVRCFKCGAWLSLAEYTDERLPPYHANCNPLNPPFLVSDRSVAMQTNWTPAGVNDLRRRAPNWFWRLE